MRPTKVLRVYTELPVIRCKHVKRRTLKNVTIKIKKYGWPCPIWTSLKRIMYCFTITRSLHVHQRCCSAAGGESDPLDTILWPFYGRSRWHMLDVLLSYVRWSDGRPQCHGKSNVGKTSMLLFFCGQMCSFESIILNNIVWY